jgi:transitional endoplasmic reticulum ATPase
MYNIDPKQSEQRAVAAVPFLPGQKALIGRLERALKAVPVVALTGPQGMGRTTVLRELAARIDADYIDLLAASRAVRAYPAEKSEEVILDMVRKGLNKRGAVVFDGYCELVFKSPFFLRENFFQVQMLALINEAIRAGRRLVLGGNNVSHFARNLGIFGAAAAHVRSDPLLPEDYATFFRNRFGDRVAGIDFELLHNLAPQLNLHQLTFLANRFADAAHIDFDGLRTCLESEVLGSNLKLEAVEELHFDGLPGAEHIAQVLETHVILPFERPYLARELGLKPRRGVLLYGAPGTGKTSIGRALAHRMKGRFFLIDGSVITEPPLHFFQKIDAIVARAKANAPSVLFIDDADVLFGIEHIQGLSRYLLSLLDGVESESASEVCIVLTAMDAAKLPSALLRSGRVELWLETKLPDSGTRARILDRWVPSEMVAEGGLNLERLADVTEGFTPADLRRLTADAKLFYADDLVSGRPQRSAQDYFDLAVADLIELRAAMERRLDEESQRRYYA